MDLDQRIAAIAHSELLGSLSDDVRDQLARRSVAIRFAPGQIIIQRGQVPRHLSLIVRGAVRLCLVTDNGREMILALLGRDDVAGLSSIAEEEPECVDVVAQEPTELLRIPRGPSVDAALRRELMPRVNHLLGRALNDLVQITEDIVMHPLEVKLARLLLRLHHRSLHHAVLRPHRLNQGVLATMLCASRPKVNAQLQKLRATGAIDLVAGTVSIRDERVLGRLAHIAR